MEAHNLLLSLRKSGFTIKAKNSQLQVSPAGGLTNTLKQSIRDGKADILCALHREDELKRLVNLLCSHHSFSQEDYTEALELALGDQVNAVVCLTTLARQVGLT